MGGRCICCPHLLAEVKVEVKESAPGTEEVDFSKIGLEEALKILQVGSMCKDRMVQGKMHSFHGSLLLALSPGSPYVQLSVSAALRMAHCRAATGHAHDHRTTTSKPIPACLWRWQPLGHSDCAPATVI